MAEKEKTAAVHGMWWGTISFGLVSVPVSLFPALRQRPTHLRMFSKEGAPLHRQYICPLDGKVLDSNDIVRGYKLHHSDTMVLINDDELEALAPEKSNDISLKEFVKIEDVPALHFDHPYFLVPSGGSYKAYRLLAHVMEKYNRAGIATFVMRGKEYLVAIIARNGLLMAETMRFADELSDPKEIGLPARQKANGKQVDMFKKSISSFSRKNVNEKELEDNYAERLQRLINKKKKSPKAIIETEAEEEEEGKIIDLVAIFKERMKEAESEEKKSIVQEKRKLRKSA